MTVISPVPRVEPLGAYDLTVTTGNILYYGDNLDVLRQHIPSESVDLVYLDPPFNSNATYNVLFAEQDGSQAAAQIKAFTDTWHWDRAAVAAYEDTVERGGRVADALIAMRTFLGGSDMLAYLSMMAPRLVELRRVMKPTATIYLHCDPTASHYLKMLMDSVFGADNFRNEIIWHYNSGARKKLNFGKRHDMIFRYSRTKGYFFDDSQVREPYSPDIHIPPSKAHYYDPRGKVADDVWRIPIIPQNDKHERLGYPTQKPITLLDRIIRSSCPTDGVVLDPFCGCGTAVDAAQRLRRQWIGIDITHLAVNLIKHRLRDAYGDTVEFNVIGEPTDVAGARDLAASDPYQFQWWALGLVGARPVEQKKGADKGIDGRLFFHDEQGGETKQVIMSVKAGHVTVSQLRDLGHVVTREHAVIGVLISMELATRPMREEAASAGFYEGPWGQKYPRLQLFAVAELLDGRKIEMPDLGSMATNVTHRRASKAPGQSLF